MRALAVVVLNVTPQDRFEVAAAEDEEPVETLGADGADEPLCVGVRFGCAHGRGETIRMPSLRNTSSNAAVNPMKEGLLGEQTLLVVTEPEPRRRVRVVRWIGSQPQTSRFRRAVA